MKTTDTLSGHLAILGPFVLLLDLGLFLRGEVIDYVEELPDLLRCLALDHVGDSLAAHVKEWLDIEIVCSQDDFKTASPDRLK